jgi:hypothetical protein
MGITTKPSRNLTTKGGIAIKNVGHAQLRRSTISLAGKIWNPMCSNFSKIFTRNGALMH